jgi:Zn-dependent protease with chaperone function
MEGRMNGVKTVGLMVALTLMLLFIGALLGGKTGMTFALIISLGMNFFTYWFSDKIILRLYGAQPVDEADAPQLYEMVRRLAQGAELPMPRICLIDQEQPNAFATGRNPEHGVVAVTSGIMRLLAASADGCESRNRPYVHRQPPFRRWPVEALQHTSSNGGKGGQVGIDELAERSLT